MVGSLSAQRERTVTVTATGSYVGGKYETFAEGQTRALQEAKKQALREAGVAENISSTADCYLRVFLLGKHPNSNAQIYPLDGVFKDVRMKAGENVPFPPTDRKFLYDKPFEYTVEMEKENDNLEQDVLLIVALKKSYPFTETVSYESVIRWLSKIKRNEKCVLWQGVNIIHN
jgi:hypothetical protein